MSSWPSARSVVNSHTPAGRADDAAREQHEGKRKIERAPPPIADRARERRGRDVAGDARDRDRGRDAEEDEQRRHQEAAADPEHAGDESDREPHRQDDEDVDRQVGDRKVDLQAASPSVRGPKLPVDAGASDAARRAHRYGSRLDRLRGARTGFVVPMQRGKSRRAGLR